MFQKLKKQSGITIIEVLLVLFLMTILFVFFAPVFTKMKDSQVLKNGASSIFFAIDKAHSQTLASLDASSYGVRFEQDQIIIFKGTSYVLGDSNNEIISIQTPATITNVTLNGISGTSGDFYFKRLSGAPNKTGSITLSLGADNKIINILATGIAN